MYRTDSDLTLDAAEREIERLAELTARLEEENQLLEEALDRNTRMFEALLSESDHGITLTGPDRTIVRVVKGITGFNPGSLSGHPVEMLAVPDDRQIIIHAYGQLLAGIERKVSITARFRQADGEVVRYAATLTDMLDDPLVQGIVWNYSLAR